MNFPQNNRLLDSYRNRNLVFNPNNNALLQNNQMFMANQNLNPAQLRQFQMMQAMQEEELNKQKRIQEMRQAERLKKLEKNFDPNKAKEAVLGPKKVDEKDKEIEKKYKVAEKEYPSEKSKFWEGRTNQPYKNIIKDERMIKTFLERPKAENKEQQEELKKALVVHRVTDADRKGVEEDFEHLKDAKQRQDDELRVIYSTSNKNEHLKKFEYNHVYKYRMNYKTKDHDENKKDAITRYKKAQMKEEAYKEKRDDILEALLDQGIFDENEVKELGYEKSVPPVNNDQSSNKGNLNEKNVKTQTKEQAPVSTTQNTHRQNAAPRPGTMVKPPTNHDQKAQDARKAHYQDRQKKPDRGQTGDNGNNGQKSRGKTIIV